VITISEQIVPSAVAQSIFVKFLTNENMKLSEIPKRSRAKFDDELIWRSQVYDWSKSFKADRTRIENMRRLYLLQGKLWPRFFCTRKASY